jgi:hypothetical protein
MKRIILPIIFLTLTITAFAQYKAVRVPAELRYRKVQAPAANPFSPGQSGLTDMIPGEKARAELIGNTFFDLQSYCSLENRLYAYDDGTVGLTWMRAMDAPDFTDRGTGYNYFDGNDWEPYPSGGLESTRTGWPCYAPFGPGGEIIVSHSASPSIGLVFNKRDTKGEGPWEEFFLLGPEGYSIVWPAMITGGPDRTQIHVLALTYGSDYEGMNGAVLYYRSLDGGETWDIQHELIPDIDVNYFNGIDGNGYAWAQPLGDTLAFSVGFKTQDGYVMKSYDNGESWEKITVFDSPFTPYPGGAAPLFPGGDATQAVALDSQGKAHVVFGRMLWEYNDAGDLFLVTATEGLIYWNEDMPVLDTTLISTFTLQYLEEGGNLIGWMIPFEGDSAIIGYGDYYVSLTSHPQIQIDENDNIFVTWMGVAPGFKTLDKNYRHILGAGSTDGGMTWSGPADYNTDLIYYISECSYPVMSPTFPGGLVHLSFLEDPLPGIHVWANGHEAIENTVMYTTIPADDFLVGIGESTRRTPDEPAILAYPNPFSDILNFSTEILQRGRVELKVMDFAGRVLITKDYGELQPGVHTISIDGEKFSPGIYLYRISAGGYTCTGKLVRN